MAHQLVVSIDVVSLLGKKINLIKENTETVLDTNEESARSQW